MAIKEVSEKIWQPYGAPEGNWYEDSILFKHIKPKQYIGKSRGRRWRHSACSSVQGCLSIKLKGMIIQASKKKPQFLSGRPSPVLVGTPTIIKTKILVLIWSGRVWSDLVGSGRNPTTREVKMSGRIWSGLVGSGRVWSDLVAGGA